MGGRRKGGMGKERGSWLLEGGPPRVVPPSPSHQILVTPLGPGLVCIKHSRLTYF